MEGPPEKQETAARLVICVAAALILYYGAPPICDALKLSLWEEHRPWLEKNRVMVIAGTAAVLFALSLMFFPPEKESLSAPEGFVPCGEGEPVSASC